MVKSDVFCRVIYLPRATGLNNVCACARGQHNKIKFRRERDVWFSRVQLNDHKKGAEIFPLFWYLNANISFYALENNNLNNSKFLFPKKCREIQENL